MSYPSSMEPIEQAALSFEDLVVRTKSNRGGKKDLLVVEGKYRFVNTGLNVIMGSSGAGKTTLLNVLSGRLDEGKLDYAGIVHLHGMKLTSSNVKAFTAYVQQDDVISASLTVQETVEFTARLRLGLDDASIQVFTSFPSSYQFFITDFIPTL